MTVTAWKRGDVVRLKSGGPKMTIDGGVHEKLEGFLQYGVSCRWFDGLESRRDVFHSEALKAVRYKPKGLPNEFERAAFARSKIEGIRMFRNRTGLPLKDCKDRLEAAATRTK